MRIKWGCNMIGYSANFVKYKKSPNPNPGPDPTPSPQPPPPGPMPCIFVDAGADITARRGSTIVIGLPPVTGVSYQWYKDRVALDGWNASRIRVKLGNTVGIRLLEVIGTTSDGCVDSDKLRIFVR
jgi:alkanesulfonate monooxygenase SsuD/methylene tetrahydromethanopterin reductase-like flavin-dependent oxidoreductase (luciferase family)